MKERVSENKIEQEKPPFLYHGSSHRIEELEPRTRPHRQHEGELLYASGDLRMASAFMAKGLRYTGYFKIQGENVPFAIIVKNREEFIKEDQGGLVYVLPSDSFEPKQDGMTDEWKTKEKVKPIRTMEYPSSLDAMLEQGVQVYFVDSETFSNIAMDQPWRQRQAMFQKLESENQRREVNVKEL